MQSLRMFLQADIDKEERFLMGRSETRAKLDIGYVQRSTRESKNAAEEYVPGQVIGERLDGLRTTPRKGDPN